MAQQYPDQTLETPSATAPPLSRTSSGRRLNPAAPVFVPLSASLPVLVRRAAPPGPNGFVAPPPISHLAVPPPISHLTVPPPISHLAVPPPPPAIAYFAVPPPPPPPPLANQGLYEYFGGGGGGFGEQEAGELPDEPDRLSDEVTRAIVKQVEYYFSDLNLVTTDQLRRRMSEDPEGYVPMQVIANFKKIKGLVCKNSLLADALRTSSSLVVSDDGERVRRNHPLTNSDVEELHLRVVVAENLPVNHSYGSLMTIFSRAGRVKNIRTCYPPISNGTTISSMDMLFGHKVYAFVEYENVEDAERAVAEFNQEGNWRSGLRVRCLHRCLTRHAPGRGRKVGCEGDGNAEDTSTKHQPNKKQVDYLSQLPETLKCTVENGLNDGEGGRARHTQGRGRGERGRGRVVYQNSSHHHRSEGRVSGNLPSSQTVRNELAPVTKQPPGPRMPDGTRGFTMGRGKPIAPNSAGS